MAVHRLEGGEQPLAPLAVQVLDAVPQPLDRLLEILALDRACRRAASSSSLRLLLGAQIDAAEPLALVLQLVQRALSIASACRQLGVGLEPGKLAQLVERPAEMLCDLRRELVLAGTPPRSRRSSSRAAPLARLPSALRAPRAPLPAPRGARLPPATSSSDASAAAGLRRGRCLGQQLAAPLLEGRRIVGERRDLGVERGDALRQLGDALLGALDAAPLQRSRSARKLGERGAARIMSSCAARSTSSRVSAARPRCFGEPRLQRRRAALQRRRVGQAFQRIAGRAQLAARSVRIGLDARQRAGEGREALADAALPPLRLGQRLAPRIDSLRAPRGAPGAPRASRFSASARTCVAVPKRSERLVDRLARRSSAPARAWRRGCAARARRAPAAAEPGSA